MTTRGRRFGLPDAALIGTALPAAVIPGRERKLAGADSMLTIRGYGSRARRYGVPAWVVAQLNKVSAEERIAAGRTLIVPRMAYAPGTGTGDPALADAFVSVLLSGIKPDPAPLPEGTTEVSEKTEP